MTKPVITKRATKGSALTYDELDTNFQNLDDATITVNGDTGTITNNLNDTFTISGGTALTSSVSGTTLTLNLDNTAVTPGSYTAANITVDAQGRITAASNTVITSDKLTYSDGTTVTLSKPTSITYALDLASPGSNTDKITLFDAIEVNQVPGAYTGWMNLKSYNDMTISAGDGTSTGAANGKGQIILNGKSFLKQYVESQYDGGTISGTITPTPVNGSIQYFTLSGNITINPPYALSVGESVVLLLKQDATGGRTLTVGSQLLFPAGASKSLSSAANAKDMLTICYTPFGFICSLVKGFA